jgi:hypothetical protein
MKASQDNNDSTLKIEAWNTQGEDTTFDCDLNQELYGYFIRQEPIAVLLLIDKRAKLNQELENVYMVSCETIHDDIGRDYQHYHYELRPDDY